MSVLLKDGAACVCSLPKFVTWMLWLCGIWFHSFQKYPDSKVTGLSNSKTQKVYIDSIAKERGLLNLEVCQLFSCLVHTDILTNPRL
jgi:hypothetical protein